LNRFINPSVPPFWPVLEETNNPINPWINHHSIHNTTKNNDNDDKQSIINNSDLKISPKRSRIAFTHEQITALEKGLLL
jgi:hypothetical protein